jgi:hypothetical protein
VRTLLYSAGKRSQNGANSTRPSLLLELLKPQMLPSDRFKGDDLAPADYCRAATAGDLPISSLNTTEVIDATIRLRVD